MNKIIYTLATIAAAAISVACNSETEGTLKVMSYNIRFDSAGDGENICLKGYHTYR